MSTLYLTQIILSPKNTRSQKAKSHPKRQVSPTLKTDTHSKSVETKHHNKQSIHNSTTFNNKTTLNLKTSRNSIQQLKKDLKMITCIF